MGGVGDPSKPRPTWVRWRIVALLMAFSYVSWFLRVSMAVAYDERIQYDFPIDPQAMGWVYTAFLLTYMLFMTPGGWLIDRLGVRSALTVMGFGLVVFGALTGLVGASPRLLGQLPASVTVAGLTLVMPLVLLLICRSLMGVLAAPMYPAAAHGIAQWVPFRRRGWANGLVQGAAGLGIASTPLFLGTFIDWFTWPTAFLLLAVGTGLLTIIWAKYAADRPEQHPSVNPAERALIGSDLSSPASAPECGHWLGLLRNRSLVCLTLSYAAVGYFEYMFFFWMDHYFKEELKLSDDIRRLYAGFPPLAMMLGMGAGGWISDRLVQLYGQRLGRAIVPVGGMLLGAAFLLLGIAAKEPTSIVTCFSIALGAMGAVEAPTWTTAQELGGRRGGLAAGLCNTGGNAGGLLAPVVTPLIAVRFNNWSLAIGLAAAVCLVGVVLWYWIDPHERVAGA